MVLIQRCSKFSFPTCPLCCSQAPSTSKMASLNSSRSLWISCSRAPFLLRMSSSSERSSGLRSTGTLAGRVEEYSIIITAATSVASNQVRGRGEKLTMWLFPRHMLAGGHCIHAQYCLNTGYNAVEGHLWSH